MAKQLQLRRGTTVQHSTFTGAVGEVTIDTDKDVVVVHDGATVGGFPSQKELVSGTNIKTINSTTILGSGNISVQPTLESGTNIKTINNASILGSGNLNVISAGIITGGTTNQVLAKNSSTDYDTKWYSVQEPLVSGTNIKTVNSTSLLGSGDVAVQATLVSGTNIKTINSTSLLGSGDIAVPQLSGLTAYHLLEGSLALASTTPTSGFSTTLYTGNGSTQSITTGVDMATQWGNDARETFGGLVWVKSRSATTYNDLFDTIRGINNRIFSNATDAQNTVSPTLTAFNNGGFTVGNNADLNTSAATYASWNFQTTHRTSGTTNHGKAYTCHYNPYTGFTMVKYEGSGVSGHEIPHLLGRKLGFVTFKKLSAISNWGCLIDQIGTGSEVYINNTSGLTAASGYYTGNGEQSVILGSNGEANASGATHIIYGWANSYFDSANTLIGNYEIGVYQGTGASGNKITTRGKPAWLMVKRLDSTDAWYILDNQRGGNKHIQAESSNAEGTYTFFNSFDENGFTCVNTGTGYNASGGQYLYMVVYDNDSGSGKSKYPKPADAPVINLTAKVPFANGVDVNGTKLSILNKNESIIGVTLSQGKNYVYCDNTGAYGKSTIAPSYGVTNPASGGDFFNLNTFKWYTSAGAEIINSRNYLDAIVYGDTSGNAEYIEQLPKTVYYDRVKANRYEGKNACTAWVNFDGTTTPPTIRDSFNVSKVIRTATGVFDVYFENNMDNSNYTVSGTVGSGSYYHNVITGSSSSPTTSKFSIDCVQTNTASLYNGSTMYVQVFGGKN